MEKENTNKHTPFQNKKCKVCRVHIFYVKVEIAMFTINYWSYIINFFSEKFNF